MSKRITWRCFHCGEVFRSRVRAELHFGWTANATPACKVSAKDMREMEVLLKQYREEDTALHRELARLRSEQFQALRRAEELGYSRGLQDGRTLAPA
jgi:hypothetical protein